jgi:hypothetical protein
MEIGPIGLNGVLVAWLVEEEIKHKQEIAATLLLQMEGKIVAQQTGTLQLRHAIYSHAR